jgi:hypothetical protein
MDELAAVLAALHWVELSVLPSLSTAHAPLPPLLVGLLEAGFVGLSRPVLVDFAESTDA